MTNPQIGENVWYVRSGEIIHGRITQIYDGKEYGPGDKEPLYWVTNDSAVKRSRIDPLYYFCWADELIRDVQ